MNDQTEQDVKERAEGQSLLNVGLERIKSVIDRVLWTASATEWNKQLLARAVADELGDVVAAEREACIKICETPINIGGTNFIVPSAFTDAMRKRSNA